MLEGYDVRISGQDVGRGTFSHRYSFFDVHSEDQLLTSAGKSRDAG